jgi:acyl dehydratase
MPVRTVAEIRERVGSEVGVSSWLTIGQERIDAFAVATEDRQFIHVDPEAAARTPFGGTVAHGFLSLSMLSRMAAEAMLLPDTLTMAVNYGLDRVRFIAPVPAGKRIRGRFVLDSVEEKAPGQLLVRHAVTVEVEGVDKPALTAQWLGLLFLSPSPASGRGSG